MVPTGVDGAEDKPREDRGGERDAEEDTDTARDHRVRDWSSVAVADDVDEQDGERSVQDELEQGVDRHQDRTVFLVTAGKIGPDQDLARKTRLVCGSKID